MQDFKIGGIVKAISGREKGQVFVILSVLDKYVLLVNGKSRKLSNPKKKNIKHIYNLLKTDELVDLIKNNKLTDAHIIRFIKTFNSSKKLIGGN